MEQGDRGVVGMLPMRAQGEEVADAVAADVARQASTDLQGRGPLPCLQGTGDPRGLEGVEVAPALVELANAFDQGGVDIHALGALEAVREDERASFPLVGHSVEAPRVLRLED
jgi:hypothetical protein